MGISTDLNIKKAYHPDVLTILAVEDHTIFSKEIKHAIPRHNVVFARSVEEGKLRYEECFPDITFLDIDLPDGTGFELLDYILSKEPGAYVAMITGSKNEDDVVTSHKKGARGYIIKPFTKSKVEKCVSDYLGFREREINNSLSEAEEHRRRDIMVLSSEMIVPEDPREF